MFEVILQALRSKGPHKVPLLLKTICNQFLVSPPPKNPPYCSFPILGKKSISTQTQSSFYSKNYSPVPLSVQLWLSNDKLLICTHKLTSTNDKIARCLEGTSICKQAGLSRRRLFRSDAGDRELRRLLELHDANTWVLGNAIGWAPEGLRSSVGVVTGLLSNICPNVLCRSFWRPRAPADRPRGKRQPKPVSGSARYRLDS